MDAAVKRPGTAAILLGIGVATAAAHIGNNFSTYLIGGLIDRYGFTPVQMGAWSMAELLAYAAAMFVVAPRATRLDPRLLLLAAGGLVAAAQFASAFLTSYPLLLIGRIVTGFGFGLANTALNLAAGRTAHPARAISAGIAVQTLLYALINIGLPMVGARSGVAGMFLALAALSAVFTLSAVLVPGGPAAAASGASIALGKGAIGADGWRVLAAMALFTLGSLAIWPFMERAAHAIGIPAVAFGRYQSAATIMSALSNLALATVGTPANRTAPLVLALLVCAAACGALTTVSQAVFFGLALIVYNMSWFIGYPLLLGIAYATDGTGGLAVRCSAVWLLMMSVGSLGAGVTAQLMGGYGPIGPLGMVICLGAIAVIWPLARRLDTAKAVGIPVP